MDHKEPPINEMENQTIDVFNSNELIIKLFINKLITLTVREKHIKSLDQQMNDYCYNYIADSIKITSSLNFIEIDEEDIISNEIIQGNNTWIELKEPPLSKVDTYASTLIKSGSVRDNLSATNKVINEDSKSESRYRFDSFNEKTKYAYTEPNAYSNNSNSKNKKREKIEKTIAPSYDITEIKQIEDNVEVIELRQQKILEIQRGNEEKRKQKEVEEQAKIAIIAKVNAKPFDAQKFTFDSEGNIIPKKTPKPELLSREFYWMKFDIKNIELKKSEYNKKKNHLRKPSDVIYNPNSNDVFNTKQNEKKDLNAKIPPSGSNFDILLPEIGVRITEEKKVKGGAKEFSSKYKKTSNEDYERMLNESIPQLNASLIKSKFANTMISANNMSSNFDNSVFVPYTEGNVSLEKSSYLNQSNQNPLLSGIEANTKRKDNINANAYDNSSGNNGFSLGLGINKDFAILNTSLNLTNKQFNSSKMMLTEEDMTMKMNKKFNSSLKIAMDSINDLNIYEEISRNRYSRREDNIFRQGGSKDKSNNVQFNKDEGIQYSKSIMRSKEWGRSKLENPVNTGVSNQTFCKPSELSLIRELGMKIINTKAPRSRKFNHNMLVK